MQDTLQTDILVIGSGLAGLAAAWEAAKRGCQVILLTRASNPAESNTDRAQGGIIYRALAESPEQLVADILSVGALAGPAQGRLRVAARRGLDHAVQGGCQAGIVGRQRMS